MNKLIRHLITFPYVWILLLGLLVAGLFSLYNRWDIAWWIMCPAIVFIVALFVARPLNAVYGMMGTSGSINIFFINIILISLFFSGIYYLGFFKNAGISYDLNQPHLSYQMFANSSSSRIEISKVFTKQFRDTTIVKQDEGGFEKFYIYDSQSLNVTDTLIRQKVEQYYYQNIDYPTILRNTVLTFLMQEPTDLFVIASTYNAQMSGSGQTIDKQKTEQFHWILIFQVLVGWIFFGVFISILYNKFRYES